MRKFLLLLWMVIAIASCTNQPETVTAEVAEIPTVVKEPSPKEVFLNKLDTNTRLVISVVDSFKPISPDLSYDFRDRGIRLDFISNKPWQEIKPETFTWQETEEYDDGMSVKSQTVMRHIGHAYLLKVQKDELWKNMISEENQFVEYVLQYGVLLSPDTLENKVFPMGTYVLSGFTPKWKVSRGQYTVEYFSNYEEFSFAVYDQMRSARQMFDWVNGADPRKIELRL